MEHQLTVIIICLHRLSYRNVEIISNGQNMIQSGRCPITDMLHLMVNISSKWHCYTAYQHFHQRVLHFLDCSQQRLSSLGQ